VVTPEMAHDVIESHTFLWTSRIVDTFSTVIIGIVLICHLFLLLTVDNSSNDDSAPSNVRTHSSPHDRQHSHSSFTSRLEVIGHSISSRSLSLSLRSSSESSFARRWSLILNVCTVLFFMFSFLLLLLLTVNIWSFEGVARSVDCSVIVISMVTLYHLSKSMLYGVLIARLQVAFGLSALKYGASTICALFCAVAAYTVFVCLGSPFLVYGVWLRAPVSWCHAHVRRLEGGTSELCIVLWIAMDILASLTLCAMFIRPLKRIRRSDCSAVQQRFTRLYLKSALLSSTSIVLTLLSLSLYLLFHLTILIEATAPINCLCALLIDTRYRALFDCLCARCMKRLTRNLNLKEREREHIEDQLQLQTIKEHNESTPTMTIMSAPHRGDVTPF